MLVDVFSKGITGKVAEAALGKAGITVNKNAIPFDQNPPMVASGIRIGTPAVTTRGMREPEMDVDRRADRARAADAGRRSRARRWFAPKSRRLCRKFPLYPEVAELRPAGRSAPRPTATPCSRSSRRAVRSRGRCPTSSRAPARSRWRRPSRACSRTAASCSPKPAPAPARRSPISSRRSSAASACSSPPAPRTCRNRSTSRTFRRCATRSASRSPPPT